MPATYWGFPPAAGQAIYVPDRLIAGDFPLATATVAIAAGQVLARGTVLGQQTESITVTATAGTNTGNGTVSNIATGSTTRLGAYRLVATSSTSFNVNDPGGAMLGTATVGSVFTDNQISFRINAGGTAFVAGDSFTLNVVSPAQVTATAGGSNTGNGTIGGLAAQSSAQLGNYAVTFTSATAFNVTDPLGRSVGAGAVGTAFLNQIGFTITAGGTAFAAGDSFTVGVALPEASGFYTIATTAAADGSQSPCAILADGVDTTAGVTTAPVYLTGEFNVAALTWGSGFASVPSQQTVAALRALSIFLRVPVLGDPV